MGEMLFTSPLLSLTSYGTLSGPAHLTDPEAPPSPDPLDSSAGLTLGSFHALPSPVPGSWLVAAAAGLPHSHLLAQIHQAPETVFPQSSADNRSTGILKASHAQP